MKKLLTSFLLGIALLFSVAPILKAKASATNWYNQTFPEWYLKVYDTTNSDEIFGERYTAAQVQWIVYSIPSLIINLILGGNTDLGSCMIATSNRQIDSTSCKNAAVSAIDNLISKFDLTDASINNNHELKEKESLVKLIFSPKRSFSGVNYTKNVFNKLNPITPVKAEENGRGFGAGSALYSVVFLWKAVRNISFFMFVIVTIIFSFMVMFRVKLSPQVVVTVQSVLPKIIISLILVTFSYAIAGLMVDLMYVIMGLFASLLSVSTANFGFINKIEVNTIFNFINGSLFGVINDSGITLIVYFVVYLILFVIAIVFSIISSAVSIDISATVFSILLILFAVVLLLILVLNILKVTFVLFKNLAAVLGLVIIAPLQITLGALYPQAGFGSWLKKLVSKLIVFPLTGIFIFIAYILMVYSIGLSIYGIAANNIFIDVWNQIVRLFSSIGISVVENPSSMIVSGLWGPPMLGSAGGAIPIAFMLMSIGIIMMIPKISESIDSFLAGKGIAGTAIGEAMGPFGGLAKTAGGAAMGVGTQYAETALSNRISKIREKRAGKPGYKQGTMDRVLENLQNALESMTHKGRS